MVRHDHEPPAGFDEFRRLRQQLFQGRQFLVHLNAQGLEHLREILEFLAARSQFLQHRFQVVGCLDRSRKAGLGYGGGQRAGVFHLAIHPENAVQLVFGVGVQYPLRRQFRRLIHTHIQISGKPRGKPPVARINLVR